MVGHSKRRRYMYCQRNRHSTYRCYTLICVASAITCQFIYVYEFRSQTLERVLLLSTRIGGNNTDSGKRNYGTHPHCIPPIVRMFNPTCRRPCTGRTEKQAYGQRVRHILHVTWTIYYNWHVDNVSLSIYIPMRESTATSFRQTTHMINTWCVDTVSLSIHMLDYLLFYCGETINKIIYHRFYFHVFQVL